MRPTHFDVGEGSLSTSKLEENNKDNNIEIKPVTVDYSQSYGYMQGKDVDHKESIITSKLEENKVEKHTAINYSTYGYIQPKEISYASDVKLSPANIDAKILGSSTPTNERMTLGRGATVSSGAGQERILKALRVVAAERKQTLLEEKKSGQRRNPAPLFEIDEKNIPDTDKKSVQFILNAHSGASLVVAICQSESGGCYTFGESLARALKADYIGVESRFDFLGMDVIKNQIASEQLYHNICMTGCRCSASFVAEELSHIYDFYGVRHVYIVFPPHIVDSSDEPKIISDAKKTFTFNADYSIELLKTGGDSRAIDTIGIPSPIPILPDLKEITPNNCYGLMYFTLLIKNESYSKSSRFLNLYFSEIEKTARRHSIEQPIIYAVRNDESEKKLIQKIAKDHSINIIFTDRLPPEQFALALREISQRGGIIASNGVQTIIQAFLLKGKVLYFANLKNNFHFIEKMLESIPEQLKGTAEVILGVSNKTKLLDDINKVNQINEILQSYFSASASKFEHAKDQYSLSENICLALNKITYLKWSYDPVLQSASSICSPSQSSYAATYLQLQGYNVHEEKAMGSTFLRPSKLVIRLTQPDIENLIKLSQDSFVHSREKSPVSTAKTIKPKFGS